MSKLNRSLINDLQNKTFEDKLKDTYKSIDFNYLGYDRTKPEDKLIKYGTDANINKVLFWLSSKKLDYVREPDKGGVLYSLLGLLNSEDGLAEAENLIKQRFNDEFMGYMDLVVLKLIPNKKSKKLVIYMAVYDKISLSTFNMSTEVSL